MKKNIVKKIITFLMIFYLTISAIGVIPVCAAGDTNNVPNTIDDAVNDNSEETEEAIEDSQVPAGNGAGKWGPAIFTYHFAWNAFHNQVQNDILDKNRDKYGDKVGRELKIEYDAQKQEKLGKKSGKADLWVEDSETGKIYLWEVKPRSYEQCEDKKEKAKKQLKNYVDSNKTYVHGDNSLDFGDGTTKLVKAYNDGTGVYDIEYTIYYWYGGDGLIFYCFEFSDKRKLTEEEIKERAKEKGDKILSEAREEAIEDSVNMAYVYGNDIFDYEIDWLELIKVYYLAGQIETWYINGYESWFFDTVDQQIVIASEAFLHKVNSIIGKDPLNVDFDEIKAALDDYITVLGVCCEQEFLDQIIETIHIDDREKIDPLTKLIQLYFLKYNQAATTNPPSDPLIIDLGEPGIKLHSLENGVNFDLDNNGYAEKTAWTDDEDGFLALDRDGNGKIENGGELFGDRVTLKDGTTSASGFEALAELDTNGDGKIDASDADFEKLLVWIDANHNGISEANELKSLSAHGIISISLSHRETSITDEETGVLNAETADVTISINGTEEITEISEFWFPVNTSDTTHVGIVTAGNVPDIESALANDTTGELAKWVYMFTESQDYAWKHYYLRQILYILADAQDIDPASRGGNIDARNLKVIERFMGREFDGVGGKNPNANAASILNEIYCDIENNYYNILNLYGELGGYLTLAYEYEDENGNTAMELSLVYYVLDAKLSIGENIDYLVYDFGSYLKSYDEINDTEYFDEYTEYFEGKASHYTDIVETVKSNGTYMDADGYGKIYGTNDNDFIFGDERNNVLMGLAGNDTIFGEEGNDTLYGGNGNDTIYGDEGNDALYGENGNDTLIGGAGDDLLYGDLGNDTYKFDKGDGNDIIYDNGTSDDKEDRIIFGEGISPDDVTMRINGKDMIINYGEGDSITVQNAYWYGDGRCFVEYMEFGDGTVWGPEEIGSRANTIYGTEGNDSLKTVGNVVNHDINETFYGGAGDDVIRSGDGNDTMYGEEGNDALYGENGNDTLIGGAGDDLLYGDLGNDTYKFDKGDGNDIIYDNGTSDDKEDRIIFGEGISPDDVTMRINGKDMIINYGEGDSITVQNAYWYGDGRCFVEYMEFGDGTVWGPEEIGSKANAIYGTEESDTLNTVGNVANHDINETFYGGAGDDVIRSGDGNDTIYGEEGNDTLYGGNGNDTLIGGAGDDLLYGDLGNDTYKFNKGDGNDIIYDNGTSDDKEDRIIFGEGISPDDVTMRINGKDMIINYGEGDSITVQNAYWYSDGRCFVEYMEFGDGTVWGPEEIGSRANTIYGTEGNDSLKTVGNVANHDINETFYGGAGDDVIRSGDGNDTMYGEEGNDALYGENGNDTLIGGTGDDLLYGELGNDTYKFNQGDGNDIIYDNGTSDDKEDRIIFGEGISPDDVRMRINGKDMVINYGEGDSITVQNAYWYGDGRCFVEYMEFGDGTVWGPEEIGSRANAIYGTEGNDNLVTVGNVTNHDINETFYGGAGDDVIRSGDGNDTMYGEEGNDALYGGNGNDTLIGGAGDDLLYGDLGNDTYKFDKGDGNDIIYDNGTSDDKEDRIIFGEGISPDDVTMRINGKDMIINYGEGDSITVQNAYWYGDGRCFVEYMEFGDGTVWGPEEIGSRANAIYGTEGNDNLVTVGNVTNHDMNETFYGGAGDDVIRSGDGNDTMYGEEGNDALYGENGNDTLIGGAGDDLLYGDLGNDTYKFDKGDGNDIIYDNGTSDDKEDRIIFGEGIGPDDVTMRINGKDMIINYGEGDSITVQNAYWYGDGRHFVEYIEFSDGLVYAIDYENLILQLLTGE